MANVNMNQWNPAASLIPPAIAMTTMQKATSLDEVALCNPTIIPRAVITPEFTPKETLLIKFM
jgi:hypothetical protein